MSIYKDKKVLITGASTGIGYALAEELNKRGAEVILTARSEDKLHALAEKIKASGGKAHVFIEDLSIQGSAEALYNQIKLKNLERLNFYLNLRKKFFLKIFVRLDIKR